MIKSIKILGLILFSLTIVNTSYAWTIETFDADILIKADGSIEVTEKISADFSDNLQKHGIIRNIPYIYKDKNNTDFETPLKIISVKDENGTPRKYTIATAGAEKGIKIGDANKYVQAKELYEIKYSVQGIINPFDEHDELFWNVTGNGWDAPIKEVNAVVGFEKENKSLQTKCFTGRNGSKEQFCNIVENAAIFATNKPLRVGEGLTIVVGFDKNLVPIPEKKYREVKKEVQTKEPFQLPFFFSLFPLLLIIYPIKKYRERKREIRVDKPVIPKYLPPSGLSACEVGVLFDNNFDSRDLTASIITLCLKKAISIEEIETKGLFGKSRDYIFHYVSFPATLTLFEKRVMQILFGKKERYTMKRSNVFSLKKSEEIVSQDLQLNTPKESITLSKIGTTLGEKFSELSIYADAQLKSKKLFHEKSQVPIGVTISLFLCYGLVTFNFLFLPTGFFAIITLLILILILIIYPKKKTLAGAEFKYEAECYKEFIKTAEKEQINWEERQKIFESHLPFAIALGLTKHWNSIFEGAIKIPTWYASNQTNHDFNFTRDIDSFSRSFASQSRPPQKTSGSSGSSGFSSGGSSGGGHGGGGGSSW